MGAELQPTELLGSVVIPDTWERKAAIHVADRVAANYPHQLDDTDPVSAGRSIAYDRRVRADLLELLQALGLATDQNSKDQS